MTIDKRGRRRQMLGGKDIILLVLIALVVGYVVARTRRRMGLLVTARTWLTVMIGVVIALLALWASHTHGHA